MSDLSIIEPGDLYAKPMLMRPAIDAAQHMAETAALLRRWPEMEAAIDIMIERQQVLVRWWDDKVRKGRPPKVSKDSEKLSLEVAEDITQVNDAKVSRFRISLADIEAYRERLIARVMRAVDPPDPSARRATPDRDGPDFWPTPMSLIAPLVDVVLPMLPPDACIWECAAGDRRLAVAMRDAGRDVVESDLYPQDGLCKPRDFLTAPPPVPGLIVVTNPPYNHSDGFIERGLSLLDSGATAGLVLLLRHDHLQAASRVDAFNRATREVHCNWRPIWIEGTDGQPRWSFHWVVWTGEPREAPLYLREAA